MAFPASCLLPCSLRHLGLSQADWTRVHTGPPLEACGLYTSGCYRVLLHNVALPVPNGAICCAVLIIFELNLGILLCLMHQPLIISVRVT